MSLQKHRITVRLFGWLMKFSARLQHLPNAITPPPFRLMQIGSAFWQSRVLYTAARLDIATLLGDESLDVDDIAHRVEAQPDAVFRLLRMLAAMDIFEEASPRRFRNNRLSACLREDAPDSVRAIILMHNSPEMSRPWYEMLEQGTRSGDVPFRLTHGSELYEFMDGHPEFDALFSRAMDSVEALTGDSFATDFDWSRFDRVIDVGGSKGAKSLSILKQHQKLKALVVDRDQVVREAERYWQGRENASLLARVSFRAGDLLESIPPATDHGDIYLLCAVFHGLDDEDCARVMHNLVDACAGTGARIALMELVMPESHADLASTAFDMQMFMGTRGKERTLIEWRRLFDQCGLQLEEIVSMRSFGKILVLRPIYS